MITLEALWRAGARIWRLLVARRQLEQKQVADCAMVTLNDAREVLYRLLRAGFVSLQVGGLPQALPSPCVRAPAWAPRKAWRLRERWLPLKPFVLLPLGNI